MIEEHYLIRKKHQFFDWCMLCWQNKTRQRILSPKCKWGSQEKGRVYMTRANSGFPDCHCTSSFSCHQFMINNSCHSNLSKDIIGQILRPYSCQLYQVVCSRLQVMCKFGKCKICKSLPSLSSIIAWISSVLFVQITNCVLSMTDALSSWKS